MHDDDVDLVLAPCIALPVHFELGVLAHDLALALQLPGCLNLGNVYLRHHVHCLQVVDVPSAEQFGGVLGHVVDFASDVIAQQQVQLVHWDHHRVQGEVLREMEEADETVARGQL